MYSTIFSYIYIKHYRTTLKRSSMYSTIHTQVQCPYRWGALRIVVEWRSAQIGCGGGSLWCSTGAGTGSPRAGTGSLRRGTNITNFTNMYITTITTTDTNKSDLNSRMMLKSWTLKSCTDSASIKVCEFLFLHSLTSNTTVPQRTNKTKIPVIIPVSMIKGLSEIICDFRLLLFSI